MELQHQIDHLHQNVVNNTFMRYLAACTRALLAIGFIIPGLVKIQQIPFTNLPVSNSVGYFFDAFFQASEYYVFVGIVQVLAGILLLFPSAVSLGALLYFPVILNIFIITIAIHFKGTWLIALLMLIGSLFLVLWEYDKWKGIVPGITPGGSVQSQHIGFFKTVALGLGASLLGLAAAMDSKILLVLKLLS